MIVEVSEANKARDLKKFNFASHALKGICGVAKVDELFNYAAYINELAKNDKWIDEEDLQKINGLFEKTVLQLQQNKV